MGMLAGEEVEIGLADRLRRVLETQAIGQAAADPDKPALVVLEIDLVRGLVHQGVQEVAVIHQLLRPLPQSLAAITRDRAGSLAGRVADGFRRGTRGVTGEALD